VKSLGTSEEAQGRRIEIGVVRRVLPYLWPKGQAWVKWRVVIAVASLILAKLVAVATPMILGAAVDSLSGEDAGHSLFVLGAGGLTIAYGLSRVLDSGFQQLRDVVFAKVGAARFAARWAGDLSAYSQYVAALSPQSEDGGAEPCHGAWG